MAKRPQIDTPTPESISKKIADDNGFDRNALGSNRQGRISFQQVLNALKATSLLPLIIIAAFWVSMSGATSQGYMSNSSRNLLDAVVSCLNFTLSIVFAFWLYGQARKIGLARYMPADFFDLPRKFLIIIDLIRGQVDAFDGLVERYKSAPRSFIPGVRESYFYAISDAMFRVPEKGYEAFPAEAQSCKLYYLPLSKVIVNLEIV